MGGFIQNIGAWDTQQGPSKSQGIVPDNYQHIAPWNRPQERTGQNPPILTLLNGRTAADTRQNLYNPQVTQQGGQRSPGDNWANIYARLFQPQGDMYQRMQQNQSPWLNYFNRFWGER